MALQVTIFKFKIELSDIDRGIYQNLDFRLAMHPSETPTYMLCRVLAYALNFQEGLDFSPQGLSDPDVPALIGASMQGQIHLWIEIGSPSAKKLHKASKAAKLVKVYTYKDPKALAKELLSQAVYRLDEIEIYYIHPRQLETLESVLARDNRWSLVVMDGTVTVGYSTAQGEQTVVIELARLNIV